jgi:putative transposase
MNRVAVGGIVYHVINRANGGATIFEKDKDYQHFENLLEEGKELIGMRILAYVIMPNHWHLLLYPKGDRDMGEFMRWVTTTHVRRRRAQTNSIGYGHLYQGTYKSFPVASDRYLLTVIRYIEQNPLRAKLVKRAQDWQWGSLWRREKGKAQQKKLLAKLPVVLPSNYLQSVNELFDDDSLTTIRMSVNKGTPFGGEKWAAGMITKYNMLSTTRAPGRPRGYYNTQI